MGKKRRTVDMSSDPLAPKPGQRANRHTEYEGDLEWKRSVQQVRMVKPFRNAHGGPRGLSPTETPDREKGNRED